MRTKSWSANRSHQSKKRKIVISSVLGVLIIAGVAASVIGYRAYRLWNIGNDMKGQIRYLIESGNTIGEAPAAETFSADYLGAIFGSNPELLAQLKKVVSRGLADAPVLNLGEVAAMVVTHHKDASNNVIDVAAHVIGGFPVGKRKPGFHRDGYFKHLVDDNIWKHGNSTIGFLGRDMVLFADENIVLQQEKMLEAAMDGNILPLAESLSNPLYFTMVMPNPKRILPGQLRKHVQAIVIKGYLSKTDGRCEFIFLTQSDKSATYTVSILRDMKIAAEVALKTKWKGVERETDWGTMIDPWWSYEMVQASEASVLEKELNLVRAKTEFSRVMVNVVLKSIERMGRDLAQMRGSLEKRLDPRVVDANMRTRKPGHYWSEPHRWGPNWPIAAPTTNTATAESEEPTAQIMTEEPPTQTIPKTEG